MNVTPERLALMERAQRLRREGKVQREIAEILGVSRSYAAALCDPDDAAKRDRRRRRYEGRCTRCGAVTKSDGTSRASELCTDCARPPKRWTTDVVIEAIRRFAAIHGRPPIADEWITADSANGYPPRSAVYHSTNKKSSAPFPSWQAALEAAGFPGAHSGRRTYKEVHDVSNSRYGYVILRETPDGTWEVVSESQEPTQVAALNAALNGGQPDGRWVAVPGGHWRPRALRPRTIYDWVEDTTEVPASA